MLFDENGDLLATAGNENTPDNTIIYKGTKNTLYYISINSILNEYSSYTYHLKVEPLHNVNINDPSEPNDSISTARDLGTVFGVKQYTGEISHAIDTDWISFSTASIWTLMTVDFDTPANQCTFKVYDAEGVMVRNLSDTESQVKFSARPNAKYYIVVYNPDGLDIKKQYNMKLITTDVPTIVASMPFEGFYNYDIEGIRRLERRKKRAKIYCY